MGPESIWGRATKDKNAGNGLTVQLPGDRNRRGVRDKKEPEECRRMAMGGSSQCPENRWRLRVFFPVNYFGRRKFTYIDGL